MSATMKISTILDHIDSGHMALPSSSAATCGTATRCAGCSIRSTAAIRWGLLVWATESKHRHPSRRRALAAGVVKLLLDGQQRMTSLYGVVRGKPPKFFDGNAQAFSGLRFHLEGQSFEFYQPVKMKDDPLWIDVTELMQKGTAGLGEFVSAWRAARTRGPRWVSMSRARAGSWASRKSTSTSRK
jgi:hypothetical protein